MPSWPRRPVSTAASSPDTGNCVAVVVVVVNFATTPTWSLDAASDVTNQLVYVQDLLKSFLKSILVPSAIVLLYTHTHPFNGPFSYLDFTEARDCEWQWHQLGHMQVCTLSRQITKPAPHHSVFYRPDALPVAQPTASKQCSFIQYGLNQYQ